MRLVFVILEILAMTVTTLAVSLSKPGCLDKCGNVTIPYPFGIGSDCSANSSFTVICQNDTTPFLSSIKMGVVNISLYGAVIVNLTVSPINCSDETRTESVPISLEGTPFTISAHYNALAAIGCKNYVWLRANETMVGGCRAICDDNSTDVSCNGVNCCQTTIPERLQQLRYSYQSTGASISSFCGYVFPVDKNWLENQDYRRYKGLLSNLSNPLDPGFQFAPLVLEWEFGDAGFYNGIDGQVCIDYDGSRFNRFPSKWESDFLNPSFDRFYGLTGNEYISSITYCACADGYEGNPYILGVGGCSDINECTNDEYLCMDGTTCINEMGSYTCRHEKSRVKIALISIGSALGALVLLISGWKSTKAIRKIIKSRRKLKFFKRNGGLLLEQHLSATDNGLQKTKLFSSKELTQATDHYNENRILGRGGQGTVYKGMLTDGKIVAVKKSKQVDKGDLQDFINEVVILSQVNHRNVVKLQGCCLETEVPLLVYEFIPNGTLFQHLHDPSEEFSLSWQMRVRIAREIAGALAYLHSSASAPIYHRDIKSTNILLDDKYRARISDFGMSRSVSIDQTHLTTRVIGTFGYFDPEYFQSSQFTDKSDVYSFGVVMVELLTGEKAVTNIRAEAGKSLAIHFLQSMDEKQLFDILDPRVLQEGNEEKIIGIAELARRCLHSNGRRRPTMKEVAIELEGIQKLKESSSFLQNQDVDIECNSIEGVESDDFSSISGSMHSEEPPLLDEP